MRKSATLLALFAGIAPVKTSAQTPSSADSWPSYNRTLASDRFAPQREIDPANVAQVREVCSYDTGLKTSFQTGPIVVGKVLYFTSDMETFAIDAATCKGIWRAKLDYTTDNPLHVNRGVAYLDGRLFRGQQDGALVAIDARTGKTLWRRAVGIAAKGESIPSAPVAFGGRVYVGVAGGDHIDVRGRVYAFDAATGAPVWETFLVPRRGGLNGGKDSIVDAPIANDATQGLTDGWRNAEGAPISGGASWTSLTLDPDAGLLYVPAGNAAPDFVDANRPGANLLSNSVVVLEAATGKYVRHWQTLSGDFHDWDVSSTPALITTRAGRHLVSVGTKDGHLYGFVEGDPKPVYRVAVTTVLNVSTLLTKTGTYFCPGALGGVQWNGPAYSPTTNLVYVNSVDWCSTVKVADPAKINNVALGQDWSGSSDTKAPFGAQDSKEMGRGWLNAVDADTGRVAWSWKGPAPMLAGVTVTAGGVVFTGDLTGRLQAFDATDGSPLASWGVGGPIAGGVISYAVDGRQMIAVAAGTESPVWTGWQGGPARIVVLALPSRP